MGLEAIPTVCVLKVSIIRSLPNDVIIHADVVSPVHASEGQIYQSR